MIQRYDTTPRLSKLLIANGFAFLSGLTAKDKTGGVREQTADILKQVAHYLSLANTDKTRLVKVNIWLKDMSMFEEMNAAWDAWIDPTALPARATVQSTLGDGTLVEIMAQAVV